MSKVKAKRAYDWRDAGRAIGFYRRSLHLAQHEVATLAGLGSQSIVYYWENGIKEPKISSLVAVAQALGVSEMDLLHPSDEVMRCMNVSKP